jgi:hypothetical protein
MPKKPLSAFDRLIASYYGGASIDQSPSRRVEELFDSYYGATDAVATPARSFGRASSCDDGEVLPQRRAATSTNGSFAQSSDVEYLEYVVEDGSAPKAEPSVPAPPAASQESPAYVRSPDPPPKDAPAAGTTMAQTTSEDDFMGDLKAIMRGEKLYDSQQKGLVDRGSPNGGGAATPGAPPPAPPGQGAHKIFDKIAQSMAYANSYDLGTVDLENRFAEFDRVDEQRQKVVEAKKDVADRAAELREMERPDTSARPDSADFISDLGAMRTKPAGEAPEMATSLSYELANRRALSRPFYDTGEHALLGGDEYAGRLMLGKSPGVGFSYGQIVALGDLYESVKEMMDASVAELTRLKALVASDTAFYAGRKSDRSLAISNDAWEKATAGRYLKLAEINYEHFSPAHVAMGAASRTPHGDNRSMWERHHRQAIEAAQQSFLASKGNVSTFLEWPLIINAFGDHFLTDAFAAGHLINKDVMIDRFKAAFYSGSSLNSAGKDFFRNVAKEAWSGDVAARFSKLEKAEGLVNIPLLGDVGHPDIDSASRFGKLLIEMAEQAKDRIGNLLLKALHDRLNEDGVEVTNRAGDGTWYLPGDGYLMAGKGRLDAADLTKNFNVIRKAVQQSIDDINSPSIRASNLDFSKYMDGVWRYVPQPTAAGQQQISALIKEYSDPHSQTLVKAAAEILRQQLDSLIHILVDEVHALQPA